MTHNLWCTAKNIGAITVIEPIQQFLSYLWAQKKKHLSSKIRVAAVSYLNTKPLLYGIERSDLANEIELIVDYPSQLVKSLQDGNIDLALLPVAAMPGISGAHIVSDYGIAAEGNVVSVALFTRYLSRRSRPFTSITNPEHLCGWRNYYWKSTGKSK